MEIFFDDTGYLLPPLTNEQREKMQNVFDSAKKLNFTITYIKHDPQVIESIKQIIKSKEDEIFKRPNGADQVISHSKE